MGTPRQLAYIKDLIDRDGRLELNIQDLVSKQRASNDTADKHPARTKPTKLEDIPETNSAKLK